jgi:putative ABC transport system permease protein
MTAMRLLNRIAYWLRRSKDTGDLSEEMAFHRSLIEDRLVQGGMSPDDARAAARREMGNETYMREQSRAVWLWPSLEAAWQDAAHTVRALRRTPTFTIGVTLTLALGIGANAAMFSVVDRLLFRTPARMIDPSHVHRVYLYRSSRGVESETGGQYARYADLATYSTQLSQVAAFVRRPLAMGTGQDTRERPVGIVSANFFQFFDAPPALGRYFTPSEDSPEQRAPVAVLSYDAWKTEFGGRRSIIGSVIQIDAATYTIIGVAPDNFVGLWAFQPPAAYIPVSTYASTQSRGNWATTYGTAIGLDELVRRKPGVAVDAATADLSNALRRSYQKQIEREPGNAPLSELRPRALAASVLAERGPDASNTTPAAKWLSGVTLIVLLIACANVVNLVLARAVNRKRETAVRIALGVSRRRLLGQLLTEGMVLAALGGGAGLVVAIWASRALSSTFLPGTAPQSLFGDWRTLGFTALTTIAAGVVAGLAPLAQVRRGDITGDLKSGARNGGRHRNALRTSLLLLQSALSVVLLAGAGLFVQSLRNVRNVHIGFDADSVLQVGLNMRDLRLDSAAKAALRLRLLDAVASVPGATHAALQESTPFDGASSYPIFIAGIDSTDTLGEFDFNAVSADYFATMGTRILRGRGISSVDIDGAPRAAVVGQSMANVLWPRQDPIGKCMRVGLTDTVPCTYVVGVAEDIHSQSIERESRLYYYYLSAAQWQPHVGGLFVRGRNVSHLLEPLRHRLQQEMPGTSYVTVTRLGDLVDAKMRSWIVGADLFTVFGALALVLTAVGLYSVIAYNVTQRRHELGVRLALGAGSSRVLRVVVIEGVRVAAAGVAIGSVIALIAVRWMGPLLFDQRPTDPHVFGVVIATMLAVAAAASLIPAMRASRLDPKRALQSE